MNHNTVLAAPVAVLLYDNVAYGVTSKSELAFCLVASEGSSASQASLPLRCTDLVPLCRRDWRSVIICFRSELTIVAKQWSLCTYWRSAVN